MTKGYLEYLELYTYFGRGGDPKLSKEEYDQADRDWKDLSARVKDLDDDEKHRLRLVKAILYRDKP